MSLYNDFLYMYIYKLHSYSQCLFTNFWVPFDHMVAMIRLSWKCQGLMQPSTVNELIRLITHRDSKLFSLCKQEKWMWALIIAIVIAKSLMICMRARIWREDVAPQTVRQNVETRIQNFSTNVPWIDRLSNKLFQIER